METLKKIIKKILPDFVLKPLHNWNISRHVKAWENEGCPIPPPHTVKQFVVTSYQKKYGYKTLVETGTFLGDMVEAQKKRFAKIISIELGQDLFLKAKDRFSKDGHIQIFQGDSSKVLPVIMQTLNEPAIFWLDGHYSHGITAKGDLECPIIAEAAAILKAPVRLPHVLLIDDARDFTGQNDYPTIEALENYVQGINSAYRLEVKDDIIRFTIPQ